MTEHSDKSDMPHPNGFTDLERAIIEYGAFRAKGHMAQAATAFRQIQRELAEAKSEYSGDLGEALLKIARELRANKIGVVTAAVRLEQLAPLSATKRIDLSTYINGAGIDAADMPHSVIEKLQRVIDSRTLPEAEGPK